MPRQGILRKRRDERLHGGTPSREPPITGSIRGQLRSHLVLATARIPARLPTCQTAEAGFDDRSRSTVRGRIGKHEFLVALREPYHVGRIRKLQSIN
jgi:hypothetical protein